MKIKWILLLSLCSVALQANAEESVVLDSQSIGESPAAAKADTNAAAPSNAQAESDAANKQQFLKGGKMSARERVAVAKAEMAETNKKAGEGFLASNRVKPGVISLPSGVQYRILRSGTGKTPTEESTVRCRYKGKLIDGTPIDKADEKKPASMRVAGFLTGLKEAVKLMSTGSKWEIVIPPQLAYGPAGNRGVGPNAVLIYEMELLGVK